MRPTEKAALCARAEVQFGVHTVQMSALLDAAKASDSAEGKKIAKLQESGTVVPAAVSAKLVEDAIVALAASHVSDIFVSGFPATLEELDCFEKKIQPLVRFQGALQLECDAAQFEELTKEQTEEEKTKSKAAFEAYSGKALAVLDKIKPNQSVKTISLADAKDPAKVDALLTESYAMLPGCVPTIVLAVGGVGSGMRTQTDTMVTAFGYTKLCPKHLLEEAGVTESFDTMDFNAFLLHLTKKLASEVAKGHGKFILPHIPHKPEDVSALLRHFGPHVHYSGLLAFDVPREKCLERAKAAGKEESAVEDLDVKQFKSVAGYLQ